MKSKTLTYSGLGWYFGGSLHSYFRMENVYGERYWRWEEMCWQIILDCTFMVISSLWFSNGMTAHSTSCHAQRHPHVSAFSQLFWCACGCVLVWIGSKKRKYAAWVSLLTQLVHCASVKRFVMLVQLMRATLAGGLNKSLGRLKEIWKLYP